MEVQDRGCDSASFPSFIEMCPRLEKEQRGQEATLLAQSQGCRFSRREGKGGREGGRMTKEQALLHAADRYKRTCLLAWREVSAICEFKSPDLESRRLRSRLQPACSSRHSERCD